MLKIYMLVAAICLVAASDAYAQRMTYADYDTQLDKSFAITPVGFDLGDRIDYSTGATSFFITTANLTGNNELDVSARFVYRVYDDGMSTHFVLERDIPYLVGIFSRDTGWIAGSIGVDGKKRCSFPNISASPPEVANTEGKPGTFFTNEYWKGNHLVLPGGTSMSMNPIYTPIPGPSSGGPYKWATNENWFFSCITLADGSEGFIGINPRGEKYTFDQVATVRSVKQLKKYNYLGDTRLSRNEVRIYVSKIEDRFGNWVKYSNGKIESNDGRLITFGTSDAGNTITASSSTWTYDTSAGVKFTYPDNSVWQLTQTSNLTRDEVIAQDCGGNLISRYSGQIVLNVTSRSGAMGVFTFAARRRGLSYVRYSCLQYDESGLAAGPTAGGPYTYLANPNIIEEIALISKQVAGPGMSNYAASFVYGPTNNCFTSTTRTNILCTENSPTTRTVEVSESGPKFTRYTYGNKAAVNSGLLLKVESGTASNNISRTELYEWQKFDPIGSPVYAGDYNLTYWSIYRSRLKKKTIIQDGMAFIRSIEAFDASARPSKVISSSKKYP